MNTSDLEDITSPHCQECDYCGSHIQVEGTELFKKDGTTVWECICDACFMAGRMFENETEDD